MRQKLSEIAQAQVMNAKGGEICYFCHHRLLIGETYVQGTSLDYAYGYIGGLFCAECWIKRNEYPKNKEMLKMSEEVFDKLGIPNLKPFGETAAGKKTWDCTHSDLVDQTIIITDYRPIRTQYGDALLADCVVDGNPMKVLMGSNVLVDQLSYIKDELPVQATIRFVKNYYTFE